MKAGVGSFSILVDPLIIDNRHGQCLLLYIGPGTLWPFSSQFLKEASCDISVEELSLTSMGIKLTRNRGRYSYDPYCYEAQSIQSSSAYSYDARPIQSSSSSAYYDARSIQSPISTHASSKKHNTDWERGSRIQSRYLRIGDDYYSLEQVTDALGQAGLESSNLIVGIDFTKSNEWMGSRSFRHKSLHHLGNTQNPYEQAISIIGRTLSSFDEDNLIPCLGFGDATTHDQDVFSFYPDNRSCNGFEDVLARYRELVPQVNLAGPTSFAPIIETAIDIVDKSRGQYHVLMIIADGQVTRSADMVSGQSSPQEQSTINAIVKASEYPLSIVLVGVGDGPWDMMRKFDDNIPARAFDNFQFVNFTEIMLKNTPSSKKETDFALAALMEVPTQYKAILDLQLLGRQRGTLGRFPLPPPQRTNPIAPSITSMYVSTNETGSAFSNNPTVNSFAPSPYSSGNETGSAFSYIPSAVTEDSSYNMNCPICFWSKKDLAFGCGHQTCYDCGRDLTLCPICRTCVTTRIKLYD
ncbi:E3 ubiquitin-protein ligase RGLG5-like isoform X2 [Punica granatum]|uniref:E3 ubiquitin-protein ligase RGLG5-like isoform X2 n=1 Tax=Punica granatum TaxID=22663 RepID=A0A6P8DH79_PUNGR|nr:E3 ubiquitin-protein ligase RGLG5-like isoform X2 [Punica granatum]